MASVAGTRSIGANLSQVVLCKPFILNDIVIINDMVIINDIVSLLQHRAPLASPHSHPGDTSQRSLVKALAWRAFAACNTLFAAVVLTKGRAGVASKIAGSDSVIKTVLFYFYERAWSIVAWGKVRPTLHSQLPIAGIKVRAAAYVAPLPQLIRSSLTHIG